jgi:hypothetical protein
LPFIPFWGAGISSPSRYFERPAFLEKPLPTLMAPPKYGTFLIASSLTTRPGGNEEELKMMKNPARASGVFFGF